jgi:acetoacetate decarboxylase
MRAQAWVSLFAVRSARHDRPTGLYGAAFVDYVEGSVLTYRELLVARLVREGRAPRVRLTDIWVDSPVSMVGGRSLWAIPKELADLRLEERASGPVSRTTFDATAEGRHLAGGTFRSVPGAALVRSPFAATTSQVREDGTTVCAPWRGSGRAVPCHASWRFDADGPLAFLHGGRPVMSVRVVDVRLRFG